MRFVDSNVFLHAYLEPRRKLTASEQRVKNQSMKIVEEIGRGERVAISTAHISEVVNIIETGLGLEKSLGFLARIIASENVKVFPVGPEHYETSLSIAEENKISANDALAYTLMKKHGIKEIYSFDKHLDQMKDITRLPKF